MAILLRKLLLVTTVSLLHDRPDACARAVVAVLLLSLGAHGAARPYAPVPSSVSRTKYLAPMYVTAVACCGALSSPLKAISPKPLYSILSLASHLLIHLT